MNRFILHLTALLIASLLTACTSDPPRQPAAAVQRVKATPTMLVDPDKPIIAAGTELGRIMAQMYLQLRTQASAIGGSARFAGNLRNFFQINVSFSEHEVGFRSFEYKIECDVPHPPALCTVARAFSPAEVESIRAEIVKLGDGNPLEVRVIGRADSVWKPPAAPKTYGGECGSGARCDTDSGALELKSGMRIDSNETLACLRALCVFSESGIDGSNLTLKLRGVLSDQGSQHESRRAEIALYHMMTKVGAGAFWDTFLPAVGHSR